MPNTVSELQIHPVIWRFTGFVSSIVGLICYALSPSIQDLLGQWNTLKIVSYGVVSLVLTVLMLFVKKCGGLVRSCLRRAPVGFMVLTLTSLYSFWEDRSEQGKEEKGYGRTLNLTSSVAFALMSISLSRQLELEFEVGMFNFFLGCFLVTVMKMNLKLAPIAAFLCLLLIKIGGARGETEHADTADASSNELQRIGDESDQEANGGIEQRGQFNFENQVWNGHNMKKYLEKISERISQSV